MALRSLIRLGSHIKSLLVKSIRFKIKKAEQHWPRQSRFEGETPSDLVSHARVEKEIDWVG